MDKNILRKRIFNLRQQMDFKEAALKNNLILNKILQSEHYQQASTLFTYLGSKGEVDTSQLIEQAFHDGKKVALPKVFQDGRMKFYFVNSLNHLVLSSFGIYEPCGEDEEANPDTQTIFIVPLIAFDQKLNRIGYGKGFYDNYLSKLEHKFCIGVAFELQKLEHIDAHDWDIPMNIVVTELNIYN